MHGTYDAALAAIALCLITGVISNLLAKRFQVAPIVFYLGLGILLGKNFLGLIDPQSFGDNFISILSLGIAIILFEAGLTLDYSNYKRVGSIVVKMLSVGVILSWFINALAIHLIFNFEMSFSLLASSLIIVTGPTVIMPILRRINVTKKIFHILHWEGVMIDPIGVFLALLSYEIYITSGDDATLSHLLNINFSGTERAFLELALRIFLGLGLGVMFGSFTVISLNRKWIPSELMNAFVLAMAVTTFSVCDMIISESGLMGVVVAGLVTGYKRNIHIDSIKKFKLEITNLFIGLIFILIASGLDFDNLSKFGWSGVWVILIVIFISRPINVLFSSYRSDLSFREKLFLAWLSPRGIVAASMATIFTFSLQEEKNLASEENIWFIQTFTFSIIVTTVLFQGFSASLVARILRLVHYERKEWIIIGAHDFSEVIYRILSKFGHSVTLIDNNRNRVDIFQNRGLKVMYLDSLSTEIFEDSRLIGTSHLLALTDNIELNALTCQHWKRIVKSENLYRWGYLEEAGKERWDGKVIWDHLPKPNIISGYLAEDKTQVCMTYLDEPTSSTSTSPSSEFSSSSFSNSSTPKEAKPKKKSSEELQISSKVLNKDEIQELLPGKESKALLKINESGFMFFNSLDQIETKLDTPSSSTDDSPPNLIFLSSEREAIENYFREQLIYIENEKQLIKHTKPFYLRLIERIRDNQIINVSPHYIEELIIREQEQSFCLGNEVAIIHFHETQVSSPILGLVVVKNGIDFQAYDQKAVKIVFLLISPKTDNNQHLWMISEISKRMNREEVRKRIISAQDRSKLIEFIKTIQ